MTARSEKIEELMIALHAMRRSLEYPGISPGKQAMTVSQWAVLSLLARKGGLTVKDVAADLRISSSAATQMIDVLVKSGYILRTASKKDRRSVELNLSVAAQRHLSRMKKILMHRLLGIFSVLDDAEFSHYVALSKKIVQSITAKQ